MWCRLFLQVDGLKLFALVNLHKNKIGDKEKQDCGNDSGRFHKRMPHIHAAGSFGKDCGKQQLHPNRPEGG